MRDAFGEICELLDGHLSGREVMQTRLSTAPRSTSSTSGCQNVARGISFEVGPLLTSKTP